MTDILIDMVNHPPHYTAGKYEVIDVLEDWFGNEPLLWQAVKYLGRWNKKGDELENLEKAEFYLKRKINQLKEQSKNVETSTLPKWNLNAGKFTGLCSTGTDNASSPATEQSTKY